MTLLPERNPHACTPTLIPIGPVSPGVADIVRFAHVAEGPNTMAQKVWVVTWTEFDDDYKPRGEYDVFSSAPARAGGCAPVEKHS